MVVNFEKVACPYCKGLPTLVNIKKIMLIMYALAS